MFCFCLEHWEMWLLVWGFAFLLWNLARGRTRLMIDDKLLVWQFTDQRVTSRWVCCLDFHFCYSPLLITDNTIGLLIQPVSSSWKLAHLPWKTTPSLRVLGRTNQPTRKEAEERWRITSEMKQLWADWWYCNSDRRPVTVKNNLVWHLQYVTHVCVSFLSDQRSCRIPTQTQAAHPLWSQLGKLPASDSSVSGYERHEIQEGGSFMAKWG